jgi:hypothetical protein
MGVPFSKAIFVKVKSIEIYTCTLTEDVYYINFVSGDNKLIESFVTLLPTIM